MKKHDSSLFQIGEVAKTLGVTRKTLLVYEEMGLLTPSVKDGDSGYRYYTPDDITQVRSIRSLQTLGLSLKEIKEYFYDTEKLDVHLQRLLELRATLDRNIQILQDRLSKPGDLTVRKTTLPRQVCFCRQSLCKDVSDAIRSIRVTYADAVRTGKISEANRFFTIRAGQAPEGMDLLCCIPMEDDFDGPERMEFAETPALCIYYRGPYEGIPAAAKALMDHIRENHIEIAGPVRSIYLEGPPQRGENSADYITQVAVPIRTKQNAYRSGEA